LARGLKAEKEDQPSATKEKKDGWEEKEEK